MPDPGPTVRLAAPSFKGVVRLVAIAAACGVALYLVWRTRGVLRLAAIALFVGLTLNPIVDAFDRRVRLPRAGVILLLYAVLAGAVVVTGAVVVPSTVRQVQQLSRDAPRHLDDLRRNATLPAMYVATARLMSVTSARYRASRAPVRRSAMPRYSRPRSINRKASVRTVSSWLTTPNACTVTRWSGPAACWSRPGSARASRWSLAVIR